MAAMTWTLENEAWRARFVANDDGLELAELTDRRAGAALLHEATPFCVMTTEDGAALPMVVETGSADEVRARWTGGALTIRLDGHGLRWRVESQEPALTYTVRFPFLAALYTHAAEGEKIYLGRDSFTTTEGTPIFRHADWPLPAVRVRAEGRTLTALASGLPATLRWETLWQEPGLTMASGEGESVAWEAELIVHAGGWPAAFDLLRARVRPQFNLAEYQRPEQSWYGDQLVQHFTFLYGREILDLEHGEFDVDRFLDYGEEVFGGYDGFLIWGVYPRIGVDERTQFDFYDDFPGGRPALAAMARRARERGVRFFVPYKPWDRSAEWHAHGAIAASLREIHEHSRVPRELEAAAWQEVARQDAQRLAQLVADVEADGVFLDTMSAISKEFRAQIDRLRPGVVFCAEGRAKGPAFETITGSWDQSPTRGGSQGNWAAAVEQMPRVDLWRFLFPEHRLFVINRHAVGDDRINITQRAFFNGMGWVVWQDIFGLVLTYAPEEAALLKKCATLLRQHRAALWCSAPTPLVETLAVGVYANQFPGEQKRLWTFYNANEHAVDAPVIQVTPRPGCHFVDIWHGREVIPDAAGRLTLCLEAKSVGAVVELPRLIQYHKEDARFTLPENTDAALVVTALDAPGTAFEAGREASAGAILARLQGPWLVQAVQDGEVLDQIIIDNGPGGQP